MSSHFDILCTSAVKRYYAKSDIHRSRVTCFPRIGVYAWKQSNLPPSSSDLNLVNFLL